MKFGFRIPSITKRIAAQTSVKRIVQKIMSKSISWLWLDNQSEKICLQ